MIYQQEKLMPWTVTPNSSDSVGLYDAHVHIGIRERRLPIMIHAGVGDPAVGMQTLQRAKDHPEARLILAHCAVGAYEQVAPQARKLQNVD